MIYPAGSYNTAYDFQVNNYVTYMVAIYDRMSYTINNDGSSRLQMLKLPLAAVQPEESSQAQQPTNSMQSILSV